MTAVSGVVPPHWALHTSLYALWRDLDGTFCRSALIDGVWRTWRHDTVTYPNRFPFPTAPKKGRWR